MPESPRPRRRKGWLDVVIGLSGYEGKGGTGPKFPCPRGRDSRCFNKGKNWIGLDWIGLDWIGLDWIGLDWIGLDWIGLDWIGLDAA
jgi:hypothetical protein